MIEKRIYKLPPKLKDDASLEELIKFVNYQTDIIDFLANNLSLQSNFDGQILKDIEVTAGQTKKIYHSLGIIPKFRLTLLHEGNGILEDLKDQWTNGFIVLRNPSAASVTATIMLLRE